MVFYRPGKKQQMNEERRLTIQVKRIYETPSPEDGVRILVDRLWPRGVSKERAAIDEWMKEIAPSPKLRIWFGHRPERFATFAEKYAVELAQNPIRYERAVRICELALQKHVTLVYAAKDPVHNHANVLRDWLVDNFIEA
ncbi:MAG: DUF488 domain-containing protein [Shouchella clausii]